MTIRRGERASFPDDPANLPSEEKARRFEVLWPLIDSAHTEMAKLSGKKQDGIVSKLQVRTINRLLREAKELLSEEPSTAYLDVLDEEELPHNSDATLILGQFRAALEQFRRNYYGWDGGVERWFTRENPGRHFRI